MTTEKVEFFIVCWRFFYRNLFKSSIKIVQVFKNYNRVYPLIFIKKNQFRMKNDNNKNINC